MKASEQIDSMASTIGYPRAHSFELACALSFVSGRVLPELVGAVVQFSPSIHGPYGSQVKHGDLEGYQGTVSRIPLLCEYDHFIEGVHRLRGMKDASHLTCGRE